MLNGQYVYTCKVKGQKEFCIKKQLEELILLNKYCLSSFINKVFVPYRIENISKEKKRNIPIYAGYIFLYTKISIQEYLDLLSKSGYYLENNKLLFLLASAMSVNLEEKKELEFLIDNIINEKDKIIIGSYVEVTSGSMVGTQGLVLDIIQNGNICIISIKNLNKNITLNININFLKVISSLDFLN